ncbi:hypothetical protein [Nocardia sp. NPDC051832]|uniref:hypothetical protein n=1 Tax=Nocardia sp. NPDC051832 TaxID=3155673 RepID=UPI00343EA4DD
MTRHSAVPGAARRGHLGGLLAILGVLVAMMFTQSAPCHEAVALFGDEAACAVVEVAQPGVDHGQIAVELDSRDDSVRAFATGGSPEQGVPAGVLGLCVTVLFALLVAAVVLARSTRISMPFAVPVTERPTLASARAMAHSLTMLCVSRT